MLCTVSLIAGCSRNPERSGAAASPTAPSAAAPGSLLGPTSVAPGGISGKFDVSFPARNDSFDFRIQLEAKYQTGLGRAVAPTYVDPEGEVVWTQEYIRYRVNGCDHATATQRVMAQIDGQPAGQVCGAPPDGLIAFPPRTDSFDFRRQLEAKYQQFGRGFSQSAVDAEGGVIWTQEYLRYRVNQCDHPTLGAEGVLANRRRRRGADVLRAAVRVHDLAVHAKRPGCRWHIHGDHHQELWRQLHVRRRKPQPVRVARERHIRHRCDDDADVSSRSEQQWDEERADPRPLDRQLDAARDQPVGAVASLSR